MIAVVISEYQLIEFPEALQQFPWFSGRALVPSSV